jgi:hypothetical protein
MVRNAVILFITNKNKILLVRDKKDKQLMFPNGTVHQHEQSREASFREFKKKLHLILMKDL